MEAGMTPQEIKDYEDACDKLLQKIKEEMEAELGHTIDFTLQ
jgi:hypothetical protein